MTSAGGDGERKDAGKVLGFVKYSTSTGFPVGILSDFEWSERASLEAFGDEPRIVTVRLKVLGRRSGIDETVTSAQRPCQSPFNMKFYMKILLKRAQRAMGELLLP